MLVQVHSDLFEDEACWRQLDALLERALNKKCYLDALRFEDAYANDWVNQLDNARRQDWITVTEWAARDAAAFRLRKLVAAKSTVVKLSQLSLIDAIALIDQPVKIWVENDRNDRRFWLSMMPDDQRTMFLDFERRRIFEFTSRGGLDELRASLAEQVKRGAVSSMDSWVLFDSDGEIPGHRSASAAAMIQFCKDNDLFHHCLNRRAIENYIPRAALWHWAQGASGEKKRKRQKVVAAYQNMTSDQRWHYHMKSGWPEKPSSQANLLYASLSLKDRNILKDGIANDIATVYTLYGPDIYKWTKNEGLDAGVEATLESLTNWIRAPYA